MTVIKEHLIKAIANAKLESEGEGYCLPPPIEEFKKAVLVAIQSAEDCLAILLWIIN